jgi:RNA polymerase sigma-70 factor (ECF subfamily)
VTILREALVDFSCLPADVPKERARVDRASDAAFAALYAAHGARIHRFLGDLLGDRALAADATQETFVRAFRQRDAFDEARAIAPWLFGIARNVSLEMRRARHRARRVICPTVERDDDGYRPEQRDAACGSPENQLLGREALRVVESAVERLSEDRRAMLLLRLDHELSYEEIAGLMGFSVAKVKVEIFRAREILRETMADYERGGAK